MILNQYGNISEISKGGGRSFGVRGILFILHSGFCVSIIYEVYQDPPMIYRLFKAIFHVEGCVKSLPSVLYACARLIGIV